MSRRCFPTPSSAPLISGKFFSRFPLENTATRARARASLIRFQAHRRRRILILLPKNLSNDGAFSLRSHALSRGSYFKGTMPHRERFSSAKRHLSRDSGKYFLYLQHERFPQESVGMHSRADCVGKIFRHTRILTRAESCAEEFRDFIIDRKKEKLE